MAKDNTSIFKRLKELLVTVKPKTIALITVILVSIAVAVGQYVETRPIMLEDYLDSFRNILDPIQYMVGILLINLIMIVIVIKRYEKVPNPFLNILKRYFTVVFLGDFLVLLFKVVQKSNVINIKISTGIGQAYLVLAATRSIVEASVGAVASLILVYGLTKYKQLNMEHGTVTKKLRKLMLTLIILNWFVSLPLSFIGFLESKLIFTLSLVGSQVIQVTLAGLILWILREYDQFYQTHFFNNLKKYATVSFIICGLNFIYNFSSFQILQSLPVAQIGSMGAFSQFVYDVSIIGQVIMNYFMVRALLVYEENPNMKVKETVSLTHGVSAGDQISTSEN